VAAPQRILLPDPAAHAQAQQRLGILQMIFDYKADPTRFGRLQLRDGTQVTSYSRMVAYAAEQTGNSEATLYRWLQRYNDEGLAALADKVRKDKHTSRFFSLYPKAAWLAAYLFLECAQSVAVAHEAIVRDAALLEIPAEEIPAYETVRVFLKATPAALQVYARNGRKAYRDRMSPYLKRGFTDVYANQVWVGDHMIHDVECMNDCFADAEWGAPIRIRFSAMLDYRSRHFTGASWCWEGSSRAIAACMRRGITLYGPPEHVYVDNGKDYRKVAKGALPGYLVESPLAPAGWWKAEMDSIAATGFLGRLGIAVTHCIPHHPQSKCVERAFRTVHERFDKVWPTYTSGNPFTRPDSTTALMMRHRGLVKAGRVAESHHPRASQFILACLAWLEEYSETPHQGEGMDGGTPRQVFEANLNPAQKPTPEPATLALLLAEHERRQVRECAIRLNKRRYQPCDQAGWDTIHNLNEKEVLIAYDLADYENAAMLDLDGRFLAWLRVEEKVRFAPGDAKTQAQIAESMAQRRHQEKNIRERLTAITLVARQNGAQSPLEAMASRLQLRAGTDLANTDLAGIVTQRAPRLVPTTEDTRASMTPAQAARMFFKEQIQEQKTK
jgi:hypothetical protein